MAQAAATILQEINGLYVAVYGRAADGPGLDYWCGTLGVSTSAAATTAVTPAQQTALGQAFVNTQSSFFTTTYGALTDIQFVQALYVNIGGNTGDATGVQYWFNQLQLSEAAGNSVTAARAGMVGLFVDQMISIDLTVGAAALGLSASDYAAAVARQQQMQNKITVSQYYADELRLPNGGVLVAATTSSPAYAAAQDAVANVTNNAQSVVTAEGAIAAAVAANSLAPIVALVTTPPTGTTFALTAGIDAPGVGAFAAGPILGNNNLVIGTFNAPAGQVATYNAGDNIVGPAAGVGNALTLADLGAGGTGTPLTTAATVSNMQILNIVSGEAITANAATSPAGFTGLLQLNATVSTVAGGNGSTITAAGTTNIAFTDTNLNGLSI